ncbi:TIGR03619 family F420-dependent LLM class oxidoreductase [Rhodococcus hoagii]|uniref:TIGR03619 family F420-dependent LLM class oxidoreductase n=1 Tax=Rhodococcus hoagii TaxID=43767 RepID=UPI001964616E|nr:TIGR03619 family F420-dependent LLM class oxidoreductase [Prescottella equi]MBM9838147.1 TIGR03619 family F420-dependent LLM class oxidoreductase [Prescottella equi]UNQ39076.1 TIGR03619 family F420-dependent LLM class oxidoreductase [Prescottella equi]
MRIGLDVFGAERFYDGDHRGVLELAAEADRRGVDLITTSDHLGFAREAHAARVRENGFPFELEHPWLEPISLLSAVAAVTERVDLGVYVLVAPLRPALLLAKQIATLDVLSRGRTRIGMGVGWQQAEYEAAGIPFERRFGRLEETVAACRELWGAPPASFTGTGFAFDDFHSLPRPVQSRVPVIFGMAPSKRNFDRIARVGDGWTAAPADMGRLEESITLLRDCFEEYDRDPAEAEVQIMLPAVADGAGGVDFDAMAASAREARDLGVDTVLVRPSALDIGADDVDAFLTWLTGLKVG